MSSTHGPLCAACCRVISNDPAMTHFKCGSCACSQSPAISAFEGTVLVFSDHGMCSLVHTPFFLHNPSLACNLSLATLHAAEYGARSSVSCITAACGERYSLHHQPSCSPLHDAHPRCWLHGQAAANWYIIVPIPFHASSHCAYHKPWCAKLQGAVLMTLGQSVDESTRSFWPVGSMEMGL